MAYSPEKYATYADKQSAWSKAYRERNKEKEKLRHKKYKQENKEKHAANERRRRALKRNLPAESYTVETVIETYGTTCYLCDTEIDLTANRRTGRPGWEFGLQIDHLIPIAKLGSDTLENVRPTHGLCNSRKNKYSPKGA